MLVSLSQNSYENYCHLHLLLISSICNQPCSLILMLILTFFMLVLFQIAFDNINNN